MYDTQAIKSKINCVDVAKRCGLNINRAGDRMVSPLRPGASNPSSFCIDEDFWYDFGDGRGGDCIDLLAELKYNGDRGSAIRELARITGVQADDTNNTQEWLQYTQQLNARTAFYHSQLTESDRAYLHSRGLKDIDIDRLMIGRVTDGNLRGRLFLPYFTGAVESGGYVSYYATRAMPDSAHPESKYMKQKRDDYCKHIPWGIQTLNRTGNTLVIAEGYFDAASFECAGYPVISAITGNFSRDQIPTVLAIARKFDRVFIVYDNDVVTHAGQRFTERTASLLSRNRIPFIVGTVPTPYKDISEYYAAGGDLSRIIDSADDGLNYICSTFREFELLEKFIYSVARYVKRTKLDELFSRLRQSGRWNNDALTSLYKSCTTAPPENLIADEILRERQLVYVNAIGFYEYKSGYWHRTPDGVVKSYADRAYGEFSTAQRINAICNLLKTRALQDITFDRAPVWNFTNGTLELDSGIFRDHSPTDYCSTQASYPYNPNATHTAWSQFIDDVTGSDPKSAELLQFIPAYVLFPDCCMERIFVLTGSGGNGKSKYLEILRQLFGEENCSHITPRGLLDKFQRIKLQSSLVNLAGEIKSDVGDAEEYMKLIASGEPISACYKSQDFVDFTPRTKLVFACNGQLSSGDTSEGLARRLIIIDFKMRFVDYPDPNDPYQRLKNIHIIDSLTAELASGGIFNWVYAGYKLLRAVGYFTETNDQAELLNDFKRASNPILLFYEDDIAGDGPSEIESKQLYSDYRMWCEGNGYRSVTSTTFFREFKRVAEREYEPYRTKQNRGYRRRVTPLPSPE